LLDRIQDEGGMILDLRRSTITTLRLGSWGAVAKGELPPTDRARRANPETLGSTPARYSTLNSSDNTVPQITR
jgi:hypothetical protein